MTNSMKTNTDTHTTIAIIAKVRGLHKFNNATQKHISLILLRCVMPYNNQ